MYISICKDAIMSDMLYSFISNERADVSNSLILFSQDLKIIDNSIILMAADDADTIGKQWVEVNWSRDKTLNIIVCGRISILGYDEPPIGINLICVSTDLIHTYNKIQQHISFYLECVSSIKNALIADCSLQELANMASKYLNAATYVLDIGYNVSVSCCPDKAIGHFKKTPYLNNIIEELNLNKMLQPHIIKQLDSVYKSNNNSEICYYVIKKKDQIIGYFIIFFISDDISSTQRILAEGIYKRLLNYYEHSSQYNDSNEEHLFVNNLIDNKYKSYNEITNWFRTLGQKPFKHFVCVVIKPKDPNSLVCLLSLNSIKQIFLGSISTIYNKTIVIIAPILTGFNISYNEQVLRRTLQEYDAYCGISFTAAKFTAIPILFTESLSAIRFGSAINPEENIFYYEQYRRYSNIDSCLNSGSVLNNNPAFLCHPSIIRLIFHDEKYNDDLISILRAYIDSNRNTQAVSRMLFMHRNTVLSKIKKIETVSGLCLSSPNDLYSLEYSLDVLDYSKHVLKLDVLDILKKSF